MKTSSADYGVKLALYDDARDAIDVAQRCKARFERTGEGDCYADEGQIEAAGGNLADSVRDVLKVSRNIERVRSVFDALDSVTPRGNRAVFSPAIAGAYPVVGDYLAGVPECMRTKTLIREDTAPLRIFVGLGMRCTVSPERMEARGCALAALIARLSETRAVEAYAYVDDGYGEDRATLHVIPLPTRPLDLSNIAAVVASPTFRRQTMFYAFSEVNNMHATGHINPLWRGKRDAEDYNRKLRELLGMAPGDFLMRSGDYETAEEIERNPIAWTRKTLCELMATDLED